MCVCVYTLCCCADQCVHPMTLFELSFLIKVAGKQRRVLRLLTACRISIFIASIRTPQTGRRSTVTSQTALRSHPVLSALCSVLFSAATFSSSLSRVSHSFIRVFYLLLLLFLSVNRFRNIRHFRLL